MECRIAILIAVWVCVRCEMEPSETYTHSASLRSGNIKLYWKFNQTDIILEVVGQTTGWIGIGFSPNGAMKSADIFVGWVKNGTVKVTDRHATDNTFPLLDPQQNINVLGGAECDGWTMFKFSRQLAACETEYDREITVSTQRLIWAYGDSDPAGNDIVPYDYHGTKRGAESMYFLQSPERPTDLPVGPVYETFDILVSDFKIPANDTYYNCKLFKLPAFTKKHHIVKFEPVIQKGNELNVHHMLLYRCGDVLKNKTDLGVDERCYSPNMEHFETCTVVIAIWAIGGQAVVYPYEAGFSVGGENDPIYIQLETHYDNPNLESGIIDNSGLRFTYTSTLRKYDIGVLETGSAVFGLDHIIPPGAETFTSISHCTPDCIDNRMTDSGVENITVVNVVLHSHLAGRKLRLRHIRDGVELPYIAMDNNYDFNYQDSRALHPPVVVKNTDSFQMECVYNTENRDTITEGGLSTMQEMCLSYVFYYPKLDWGHCVSSVTYQLVWPYLGINMTEIEHIAGTDPSLLKSYRFVGSSEVSGKTVFEYLSVLNWTQEKIQQFETFYNTAEHYEVCIPLDKNKSIIKQFEVTNISSPYVKPSKTCLQTQKLLSEIEEYQNVCPSATTIPYESTTSDSTILKFSLCLPLVVAVSMVLIMFG
ncbi:DBH-like monooxygenase protein 1 homolog [Styela clava]